ncbi:MAG: rRNA large subunit methyltransferase I [Desulfuromonas sp.]|nr:MAG: rRNA large subunit methyltransferase I [Desulfuromonas sp.]
MRPTLTLRRGGDRRLRAGHPWIFSNEIETIDGRADNGSAVDVLSASGRFLGTAYYNRHSLIAARLLSRDDVDIDSVDFFRDKLAAAQAYRDTLYEGRASLRLVYGEGDGLPGLVVDRYGDVLSIQILTLGLERRLDLIVAALKAEFNPVAIVARNDVAVRQLEGLEQEVRLLYGSLPEPLIICENGLRFKVDILGGQKTGHFLDQKENHLALKGRVEGRDVLDLFCYSGSWSMHAARFGARSVTGIDISAGAVALCRENARLNFCKESCTFIEADVFAALRQGEIAGKRWGAIVLDPPAFVKSKKKLAEAIRGYLTINRRAMELLAPGGYLFTCSCSHHMDETTFLDTLRTAAAKAGRSMRLVEMRGQSSDHPVLLACPETSYLKCAILQAL